MKTLRDMFTEPTAHHLCDSGSIYGRNYQRNALRDLDAEPSAVLNQFGVTVNVYQCLKRLLSEDDICRAFNALPCEAWDSDIYGISADQQIWLEDRGFVPNTTVNTYNYETNFDQIVQYTRLDLDGEPYVLLQIHGGCDARSGYTDAKLFHIDDPDYFLMDDASFYLEAGQAPNPHDFPISIMVTGSYVECEEDPDFTLGDLPEDLNVEGDAYAVCH